MFDISKFLSELPPVVEDEQQEQQEEEEVEKVEFDINSYVLETLKPLDIPVYFVSRKEVTPPLVIFNTTGERGVKFWDDEEMMVKYKVSINIFSRDNFIPYKKQILDLMKKAGFKRTDIPECIYQEDSDLYNQPMFFEIIEEKEGS